MGKKKKESVLMYEKMNSKCKEEARNFREYFKLKKPEFIEVMENNINHWATVYEDMVQNSYENNLQYILSEYAKTNNVIKIPMEQRIGSDGYIQTFFYLRDLLDIDINERIYYVERLKDYEKKEIYKFLIDYLNEDPTISKSDIDDLIESSIETIPYDLKKMFREMIVDDYEIFFIPAVKENIKTLIDNYDQIINYRDNYSLSDRTTIENFSLYYIRENFGYNYLKEYYKEIMFITLYDSIEKCSDELNITINEFAKILFKDAVFDDEKTIIIHKSKREEFKHKSWKELEKIAISKGYKYDRSNGDHGIYKNKNGNVIVIPRGREVGKGLQIFITKCIEDETYYNMKEFS